MEARRLLTVITVDTTGDASGADGSNTLSLRQAIEISNGSLPVSTLTPAQQGLITVTTSAANTIDFAIPASTSPNLDIPAPGFDPTTQDWTIAPKSALPPITHQVTIDGYTQAEFPVPFRYPSEAGGQSLSILGSPTGGTFTLTTSAPLPVRTTAPIPFNANAAQVLAALNQVVGVGNVFVSGGPSLPGNTINISFTGIYDGVTVPPLTTTSSLTGGNTPEASIASGTPLAPTDINSSPNSLPGSPIQAGSALNGNNANPRLIIDGSLTDGAPGFVFDASKNSSSSDSILRGLIIDGFGVGVEVPHPNVVGVLIQGNNIGQYLIHPVDPATGIALTTASGSDLAGWSIRFGSGQFAPGRAARVDERDCRGVGGAG